MIVCRASLKHLGGTALFQSWKFTQCCVRQYRSPEGVLGHDFRQYLAKRALFTRKHHETNEIIRAFNEPSSSANAVNPSSGLFGSPRLNRPQGFNILTRDAEYAAKELLHHIYNSPYKDNGYVNTGSWNERVSEAQILIDRFDELSSVLCSVIDVSELIRHVHPKTEYVNAATSASSALGNLMQQLNTDARLYQVLLNMMSDKHAVTALTAEECRVAQSLLDDFPRSGVHLPPADRSKFVSLNDEINSIGYRFFKATLHTPAVTLSAKALDKAGLDASTIRRLEHIQTDSQGYLTLPTTQQNIALLLSNCHDQSLREHIYRAAYREDGETSDLLGTLLNKRHALAQLLGHANYASFALQSNILCDPQKVGEFLSRLRQKVAPKAIAQITMLTDFNNQQPVYPWDRTYLMHQYRCSFNAFSSRSSSVHHYFSLGDCMNGIALLLRKAFGLTLMPVKATVDEIWHPSVIKLAVLRSSHRTLFDSLHFPFDPLPNVSTVSEDIQSHLVGYLYMDMYHRPGKTNHAAHFTVQLARHWKGNGKENMSVDDNKHEYQQTHRGLQSKPLSIYQVPIVAVTCDFAAPQQGRPPLLSYSDLCVLFHEMGHVLHSMLAQTSFHHTSGTRCVLDMVETPSILMEYFLKDKRFLGAFARHYETREPMPEAMMDDLLTTSQAFGAVDMQEQLALACLDWEYHANAPNVNHLTAIADRVFKENSSLAQKPGSMLAYQQRFGHLYGYGAGYYSYLLCRVFAASIYKKWFKDEAFNLEAGKKYEERLLKHGGAKDAKSLLCDVLETDAIFDIEEVV